MRRGPVNPQTPRKRTPMPMLDLREETTLPADGFAGALAARVWRPEVNGPSVVAIREKGVFDVSAAFPTMRDLCETADPAAALREAKLSLLHSQSVYKRPFYWAPFVLYEGS